jgi:hypothetical protein
LLTLTSQPLRRQRRFVGDGLAKVWLAEGDWSG